MIEPLDPVFQRGDDFNASIFGFSSGEQEAVVYWLLLEAFLIPPVPLMVLISRAGRNNYFIQRQKKLRFFCLMAKIFT